MLRIIVLVLVLTTSAWSAAAEYPERPLAILAGHPEGGTVDIVSRALAEGLKKRYPKGVAIVTRPGAGGSLAVAELVRAKPDGSTVILAPLSSLVVLSQINDLPYKTPDDYEPVINVVSSCSVLAVIKESPWKTIQELIATSKTHPGKLRVGTSGVGTSGHLGLEELKRQTGFSFTHVPFSGWAESSMAFLRGQVEVLVAKPGQVKPLVEAKEMRALMVFQSHRHRAFPDAPSSKEMGWGGVSGAWLTLVAPKGTPGPVLKYIHDAAKAAMEEPLFVNTMKQNLLDIDYRPADQIRADLWREYRYHTEVLTRLGMINRK